jgi:hypothetical protein
MSEAVSWYNGWNYIKWNRMMSLLIAVALVSCAAISILYFTLKNGISPMPTSVVVRRTLLNQSSIFAQSKYIVDAGSGWGHLAFHIARKYSDKHVMGLENSLVPYLVSGFLRNILSYPQLYFLRRDLYAFNYANADLVLCYLYPGAMRRLSDILQRRTKPGTLIVTIFFALPDWKPEQVIVCKDVYRTKIYVYRKNSS